MDRLRQQQSFGCSPVTEAEDVASCQGAAEVEAEADTSWEGRGDTGRSRQASWWKSMAWRRWRVGTS